MSHSYDAPSRFREPKPFKFERGDLVRIHGDVNRHAQYTVVSIDDWSEPAVAKLWECGTAVSRTVELERLRLVNA